MSLVDLLKRARGLVAGGWREPFCFDSQGVICAPYDEGVTTFDVLSALELAAAELGTGNVFDAVAELERAALPAAGQLARAFERLEAQLVRSVAMTPEAAAHLEQVAAQPGADLCLFTWLSADDRRLDQVLAAFDTAITRAQTAARSSKGAA